MTMDTTVNFSKSQINQAVNLKTVHVRRNGELRVDDYLFSFENGPWKMSEALETRYSRRDYEFKNLKSAKETILFAERTKMVGV